MRWRSRHLPPLVEGVHTETRDREVEKDSQVSQSVSQIDSHTHTRARVHDWPTLAHTKYAAACSTPPPPRRVSFLHSCDDARVVLPREGDDETTEYINANFMTGYKKVLCAVTVNCRLPVAFSSPPPSFYGIVVLEGRGGGGVYGMRRQCTELSPGLGVS